jgi:8-oxo-dGTP pyrophosphatase MutT (NUDIX family)
MFQELRRFLHLESTEEALRDFALVIEQSELLKSEIDLMAREYLNSTKELDVWQKAEKEPEVLELIKSQQDGLTSRYLNFLSGKKQEYTKLEDSKKSYIVKHPDFEKALADLKRNDFIENTLLSYRNNELALDECDMLIKAITKDKVRYSDNIVFNQNGEILIVQRQPLGGAEKGTNLWVLPGGHVDLGEDIKVAARRELLEETGFEVDDCRWVGEFEEDKIHIDYFMSMIDDREQSPVVDVDETRATAFISVKDLYSYPTQFINMWDNVYKILGIEEVVSIKKAVAEGLVKNEKVISLSDEKIIGKMVEGGFMKAQKMQPPDFEKEEKLQGGRADGKTLEDIAKKHKISLEELTKEWQIGVTEEREHTTDAEERSEITRDHLWENPKYYSKLKTIEKSEFAEFEKARALGHLIPKKVQIKAKSGQIHYAIRWVNPATGESEKFADTKETEKVEGQTFEDAVAAIAGGSMKKNEKVYSLINMGIYDPKVLTLLTGETYPQRYIKQADINLKDLPDQSETIKTEIRKEQANNDTPEAKEQNKMLTRKPEDIQELWDDYKDSLQMVIEGDAGAKFAIAYGTGGVGKTFELNRLLKEMNLRRFDAEIQPNKDQYDYVVIKGRISPVQVYAEMFRHRDKLIIFDDCDSFLITEDVQGFLKSGLDSGEDSQIDNKTGRNAYIIEGDKESGKIPDVFSFKGRVIAITNLTTKDIAQAVKSRALCSNLTMTVDETVLKLGMIKDKIDIYSADKTTIIPVTQEARDLAYEMIKENKDKLGNDLNTRTYYTAVVIANRALNQGLDTDRIKRKIVSNFDSVIGAFDEMMRSKSK